MSRFGLFCLFAAVTGGLAGCSSDYSPNTYASSAVQQANKVEPAVVVGYRQVNISANGTVGAVTGGAAGGILGSQVGSAGFNSALGTVGGTAIGTILGTTLEHIAGDTTGWEYIVRKPNGELLSLTQREPQALPVGQKVLVITGSQARIVPDHSGLGDPVAPPPAPAPVKAPAAETHKPEAKPVITAEPLEAPANPPSAATPPEIAPPETGAPVVPAASAAEPAAVQPSAAQPAPVQLSPAPSSSASPQTDAVKTDAVKAAE